MRPSFADQARSRATAQPSSTHRPGVGNGSTRLHHVARFLNPTVRLGRVEFALGGHAAWIIFMFALAGSQPLPGSVRGELLAMLLLAYALAQGGRVLHELGHALVGLVCGRQLLRIRLTAALMAVWFPDDDPVWSIRLTCLAGGLVQAAFGVALLLVASTLSASWPLGLRQSVEIIGAMHIGALGNLLPLPKMDGQYVWGTALRIRPTWLAYAPLVLCPFIAVALICPRLPTRSFRSS